MLSHRRCVWLTPAEGAQNLLKQAVHVCTVSQWLQHSDSDHEEIRRFPRQHDSSITATAPQKLHRTIRDREPDKNELRGTLNSGGPFHTVAITLARWLDRAVNLTSWCLILYVFLSSHVGEHALPTTQASSKMERFSHCCCVWASERFCQPLSPVRQRWGRDMMMTAVYKRVWASAGYI